MKQGPGRDGVRGGTPSASGMSGGASRRTTTRKPQVESRIFNKENMAALGRVPKVQYSGQSRIAFRAQERAKQQAAAKAERDKLARSLGRDTTPKKAKMDTRWDSKSEASMNQSLKRRVANERLNKAKAGAGKMGVSAAGAGAVAAALPKKKAAGAEGPKKSMPRSATKARTAASSRKPSGSSKIDRQQKPMPRYS